MRVQFQVPVIRDKESRDTITQQVERVRQGGPAGGAREVQREMESAAYRSIDCTTDKTYGRTALADVLAPSKKKWARAGA